MKKLILIILTAFCSFVAFSQESYRNGYIILNDGDTVRGMINDLKNLDNAMFCNFKPENGSPSALYSPEEIMQYRIEDERCFISKKLEGLDKKFFLEFIFDGIINLYSYFDKDGIHYFIETREGNLKELKNESRKVVVNGVQYDRDSREYIATLKTVFSQSPAVSKKVESSPLTLNTLIDLSTDFHNEVCPGEECIVYSKKRNRLKFSPGIMAGMVIKEVSMISPDEEITERYVLPSYLAGFRCGVILNLEDPFFSKLLSARTGAVVTYTGYQSAESTLKVARLTIPIILSYKIIYKKVSFSVLAGTQFSNTMKADYTSQDYGNWSKIKSGIAEVSFTGGFELSYQNKSGNVYFVDIMYETGNGVLDGRWSGVNYAQWGGVPYNSTGIASVVSNERCLSLTAGYRF